MSWCENDRLDSNLLQLDGQVFVLENVGHHRFGVVASAAAGVDVIIVVVACVHV